MKINFKAVFNRKKVLNKEGKASIEIRVYENRKRVFFSTKIFVTPKEWDTKNGLIRSSHPQANELNIQIKKIISDLEKKQTENIFNDKPFTLENVKGLVGNNIQNSSFVEFMRSEIKSDMTLSAKSKISHQNTLNKLLEFKKNEDILFSSINYTFVVDFLNFQRRKKLAENTIHKLHKHFKKYIDIAIKKGFIKIANPCKEVKVKYKQNEREVLTLDEINVIENLDLRMLDEKLLYVKDMFLFACFTGLRISDIVNLKTSYVRFADKHYSLDFITIKSKKRARIPLDILFKMQKEALSKPEVILEKYYDVKKELVFPKLSEQFV